LAETYIDGDTCLVRPQTSLVATPLRLDVFAVFQRVEANPTPKTRTREWSAITQTQPAPSIADGLGSDNAGGITRCVAGGGPRLGARICRRLVRPRRDVGDNSIVGDGDVGLVRAQHLGEIGMEPIVAHARQHLA
jgi:hypothetical protein